MRIAAYLSPLEGHLFPTGVGHVARNMVQTLARRQDVDLRLLTGRHEGSLAREYYHEIADKIQCLPNGSNWFRYLLLGTDWIGIDRWIGDVDWVYVPKEQPITVRRARLAVTVHDLGSLEPSIPGMPAASFRSRMRWRILMERILRSADLIACVSEFTRNRMLELLDVRHPERLVVVGNGASESYFRPPPLDPLVLERYGLRDRPYLLLPGSLTWRKGGDIALQLARLWKSSGRDFHLVVTGKRHDLDLLAAFQQEKRQDSRFPMTLTGYLDDADMLQLLLGAQALFFPSRYEGFGIPVVEAMAAGTPVIAGANAALPELVRDSGLLVPTNDVRPIQEALDLLMSDRSLRRDLVEKGRIRSLDYTWSACCQRLMDAMAQTEQTRVRVPA